MEFHFLENKFYNEGNIQVGVAREESEDLESDKMTTLEDELPGLQNGVTSSSSAPIEVEQSGFEVELTGKNFEQGHDQLQAPIQTVNDDDEVVMQQDDLENYNLTRDRVRREVRAPKRFGYADIVAYALQAVGEEHQTRVMSDVSRLVLPRTFD
ncbi:hypothetical protein LWI28_007274 [Acer negundo]|uniref:Uncharacterized protein n=1 Tax=Acer negundo TaxID=4023 RepID=A0AAD5JG17_ACENE|nr:hypothetical protein LWI28_007274 [Acer negundo]